MPQTPVFAAQVNAHDLTIEHLNATASEMLASLQASQAKVDSFHSTALEFMRVAQEFQRRCKGA